MKNNKKFAPVLAGGLALAALVAAPMAFNAANTVDVYATQGSSFQVTIPKTIILDGANGEGAYSVKVTGNIGGEDVINVVPDASFKMSQAGKADVDTAVTQSGTEFSYAKGVTESGAQTETGAIKMATITAGKWAGQFDFDITSTVDTTLETSVGSVAADITNDPKVGQDASQDKESVYGEAEIAASEDTE